ncbi:DUF2442 domain-containing protein [Nitrincola sp.]|uniref:DUF2442 domain-containing protein n=1 Tax=Nitrincola sp. TaxID=1926584 RepID=UPI003A95148C
MHRVTNVVAKPGYVLALTFNDGTQGEVSIADRLFGPMFLPLKDPAYFRQVRVDAHGVVCWPNEADLAPDTLYRKVKGTQ